MQVCASCQKKIIVRLVLTVLNVKPSELARELHLSESQVSKYLAGERKSKDLDLFFIEQIFDLKVNDYIRNTDTRIKAKLG
jgi:predicted transcriptional regulator